MTYNYESLLDERFQMFCQSLLVRQYPSLQCMPTRMPDGGRDAQSLQSNRSALIFQVKYARQPDRIEDPAKWLIKAINGELPKIKRLQDKRTIERYVVITNVRGTSHLDTGTIDRVQAHLDANLITNSQCWWRDDLDRRLDNAFELLLKYPDLMSGTDAFKLIWGILGDGQERERRENAIRAYMIHHYELDRKVKFKEVGLAPSSLFDLYIDVPVALQHNIPGSGQLARGHILDADRVSRIDSDRQVDRRHLAPQRIEDDDLYPAEIGDPRYYLYRSTSGRLDMQLGAAKLLLDPAFMEHNPIIVLEGAPGQGKSTLSQYLAQIHRARLLDQVDDIQLLPRYATDSPLMLPIKLELRDLALWLKGIDPWSTRQADTHTEIPTLETAIAAHIQRYSGGVEFSVADLLAVLGDMPAIVVLDALDEVADLDDRRQVVEEVKISLARLRQRNSEVRFLITSRPTSIVKSPSFRGQRLTHLSLAPIDSQLATDYARRWAKVKGLEPKDASELLSVLTRRLESPHITELAKNTMQLTILLNLISLRGPSLPDKRTDLYDTYFEVFMDRESEKDNAVRDNREFLVDLHTYLGYYLHARAEANRSGGRITTDELQDLISSYMVKQRQAPNLLPALTNAVDRIFAIVSRIEGMWEFEVQPLQEYFAARYLYDTAPYSPAGRERSGTKPDIFDGIAPNSYWLNVTRFFAGCFSKGELLDLSDRLARLISPDWAYARSLGIALVQDWVFTQSTRATDVVLGTTFDRLGLRWASAILTSEVAHEANSTGFSFGRARDAHVVIDLALEEVVNSPRTEGKAALCRLILAQGQGDYVSQRWREELLGRVGLQRVQWVEVAGWLGLLQRMPSTETALLVASCEQEYQEPAAALVVAANGDIEGLPDELAHAAIRYVLDKEMTLVWESTSNEPLGWSSNLIVWLRLIAGLSDDSYRYRVPAVLHMIEKCSEVNKSKVGRVYREVEDLSNRVLALATTLDSDASTRCHAWSDVVEFMSQCFGHTMLTNELAVMGGRIRAGRANSQARDLFDVDVPLVERTRYAKSQLNRSSWWLKQSSNVRSGLDCHLFVVSLFAWASISVIGSLLPIVEELVSPVSDNAREAIVASCRRSHHYSSRARALFGDAHRDTLLSVTDPSVICIVANRIDLDIAVELVQHRLWPVATTAYMGNVILSFVGEALKSGRISEPEALALMVRGYALGADEDCGLMRHGRKARSLSANWARSVLADGWNMPSDALIVAQNIAEEARPNPEPVMRIAERESWFRSDG